jgi:hypothetical protein
MLICWPRHLRWQRRRPRAACPRRLARARDSAGHGVAAWPLARRAAIVRSERNQRGVATERRGIHEAAAARAATAPLPGRLDAGVGGGGTRARVARARESGGRAVSARPLAPRPRLYVRRVRPRGVERGKPTREARFETQVYARRCLRRQGSLSVAQCVRFRASITFRSRASALAPAGETRARAAAKTTSSAAPSGPTSPHGGGARISEKPRGFHRCAVANVRLLHMLVGRSGA